MCEAHCGMHAIPHCPTIPKEAHCGMHAIPQYPEAQCEVHAIPQCSKEAMSI